MRVILFSCRPANTINRIKHKLKELGHELLLLVTSRGLPKLLTKKKLENFRERMEGLEKDIPTLVVNTIRGLAPILKALQPDLIFVTHFPFLLPRSIIDIPKYKCVNTHPSQLPKYRGPNPYAFSILNDDDKLGVTFHRMLPEYDTGPILLQDFAPITPKDDAMSLYDKVPDIVIKNLPQIMRLVEQNSEGIPQDDTLSSLAPFFSASEKTIDWSKSPHDIHRMVRACAIDGAIASFGTGKNFIVRKSKLFALQDIQDTLKNPVFPHSETTETVDTRVPLANNGSQDKSDDMISDKVAVSDSEGNLLLVSKKLEQKVIAKHSNQSIPSEDTLLLHFSPGEIIGAKNGYTIVTSSSSKEYFIGLKLEED